MDKKLPVAMSIAGHDPSGASGILRDIKTLSKLGVYGVGVITAITVQNIRDIRSYNVVSGAMVAEQIDALMTDFDIKYVKIGMVGNGENAKHISDKIKEYNLKAIFDPVLNASSGTAIVDSPQSLIPLLKESYIITPNIPEAEIFAGVKIENRSDVIRAGKYLEEKYGCTIIKGGHLSGEDLLFCEDMHSAKQPLLPYEVRGTGCAYSSAITAFLARGYGIREAFANARLYMQKEIERSVVFGAKHLLP